MISLFIIGFGMLNLVKMGSLVLIKWFKNRILIVIRKDFNVLIEMIWFIVFFYYLGLFFFDKWVFWFVRWY